MTNLVAEYNAGSTVRELASRFGVNRTTVLAHVERAGIMRHAERSRWDATTLAEAIRLYEHGNSLATVGGELGVNATTVATRLRQAGLELRPRRGWV